MRLRILLAAILTAGLALASAGCIYEDHDYDRHSRGSYHDERGGRYGGWDRHDRHCD